MINYILQKGINRKNKECKWAYETTHYYVPKVDELNKLLYQYHIDSCHQIIKN